VNLSEFRATVNRKTGIAVDSTALNGFINEAVQAVGEERDWPWLSYTDTFPTQADQSDYVLPVDWSRTVSVTVDGAPTRRINTADADAWEYVTDRPWFYGYSIDAGVLTLKPAPSALVTVIHRYVRAEPELEVDADEPLIPERFHGAIACYAAALVLERHGDVTKADMQRAEYERWLRRMRDAMSRSQQPSRIRIRPGAGW